MGLFINEKKIKVTQPKGNNITTEKKMWLIKTLNFPCKIKWYLVSVLMNILNLFFFIGVYFHLMLHETSLLIKTDFSPIRNSGYTA